MSSLIRRRVNRLAGGVVCLALCLGGSPGTSAPAITSFTLIHAVTDQPVAGFDPLTNGAVINLALPDMESLTIRANAEPGGDFGSVQLVLTGATTQTRTENSPPWALNGDNSGDYSPFTFNEGEHTLTATPYPQDGLGGTAGTPFTITFTVLRSNIPPPAPPALEVTLTRPLPGAQFLAPATLSLAASVASTNATVERVEFFAGAALLGQVETAPYTLVWSNVPAALYTLSARVIAGSLSATSAPIIISVMTSHPSSPPLLSGELKLWHRVTLTFDGPETSETATPNPFRDYRLNATFTHPASGASFVVPGYYAADGQAADTGATNGNKWRVHFVPNATGRWDYVVSFRAGPDVALTNHPAAGTPVAFDGAGGSFVIGPTDKIGRDLRAKGRLEYVGKHHLRFAGNGEYFLKVGADSPENLLDYEDFDDTPNVANRRKSWSYHAQHYDPADAADYTWRGGRGTNLLGALRYLADKGMNAFSFIPFTTDGDDHNVFPHLLKGTVAQYEAANHNTRWATQLHPDRFDVSKLDQWFRVFAYGEKLGMYLHFKTLETENELKMDNGNLGPARILYYRELIARFGCFLALNWNLGEEINDATTLQKQAWSRYFYETDPYHHPQVIHNGANHYDLLGANSHLTGFSLQYGPSAVFSQTLNYIHRSADAGVPWVVANDEQNPANDGIVTDAEEFYHDSVRGPILWGNLLAGGAGIESYFGYGHPHNDLNCEDWNTRSNWWNQGRYALEFFKNNAVPFWDMRNRDDLLAAPAGAHCLALTGLVYVIYLPFRTNAVLDLRAHPGLLGVQWFDPRHGGRLHTGQVSRIQGGAYASLGWPPAASPYDWVALVRSLETFANWQQRSFSALQLAQPEISGPNADPDADGLNNAAEYATGGDPWTPEPALQPSLTWDGARLQVQARRRWQAADAQWLLETTASLNTPAWTPVESEFSTIWLPAEAGASLFQMTTTPGARGQNQRFFRLWIQLQP